MKYLAILLLIVFLSPASSAVSGEIYKWKDKDRNVFFYDIPPPPGVSAEIKEFKEDKTEKPKTREYAPKSSENIQGKRAYRDIHVIMYMTSWCPYCAKAKNYLRSLDVNLIEYNIEQDKSKREEMLSKSGGSTGVPLIDIERIIIRGYSSDAIKTAIERRRNL
jgi:glutaredoxin 3